MLSGIVLLLSLMTANADVASNLVHTSTIKISREKAFAKKWQEFESLKSGLLRVKSDEMDTVLYKNGMLEMMTALDKDSIANKKCLLVKNKIDSDYKVTSRSGVENTPHYKDTMKLLKSLCK
ncbi:MAG: hypothetical protein KDD37_05110 [Bdellovibrionales bacterium]|nr:hypothetical protein [Bdellovibrionales bacterium]